MYVQVHFPHQFFCVLRVSTTFHSNSESYLICLYASARKYMSLLEGGGLLQGWEFTPTFSNVARTVKQMLVSLP